jgi:DNA-directed RNA polymerase subunit RPC12/RpoP
MSKAKYVTQVCSSCGKETKMETIGAVVGSENKVWYRCTRCHHSIMIETNSQKEDNVIKVTRENCIDYSPEKIFEIGNSIYHTDWDDMGRVKSKEKTSSGGNAIWVEFEKNGTKKLIENLQFAD